MFTVKDIMTDRIITVDVDEPIDHAIALMIRHRISGLPVLNEEGRPVGVISEYDLLTLICDGGGDQGRVRDYMSPGLDSVCEDDDWVGVADIFRARRLRRLPVLRDGMLVGIVTRRDLVRAIHEARGKLRRELTHQACKSSGCQARVETEPAPCPAAGATVQ